MGTPTDPPAGPAVPKLPDGLLSRALAGPSDKLKNPALLELMSLLLPHAMDLIRGALDGSAPRRKQAPTTGQMQEIYRNPEVSTPDDSPSEDPEARAEVEARAREARDRAVAGAMEITTSTLHRRLTRGKIVAGSLEELALHLIRITYNRYQNDRRRRNKLGRQADSGARGEGGGFLASRPGPSDTPEAEAELRDFLEYKQRLLADGVLEGFSPRDCQILFLSKLGYEPSRIVGLVNRLNKRCTPCTLSTVKRVIERFEAQLERFEGEENPAGG